MNPIVGDISVISILGGGLGWIVGIFSVAIAQLSSRFQPGETTNRDS
ncbi:MAG: hypothetical protein MUD14_17365 [Hydrococcus sp. Prado102]|nr:hypothetical protein [Hydrococcus sp. Prado102]